MLSGCNGSNGANGSNSRADTTQAGATTTFSTVTSPTSAPSYAGIPLGERPAALARALGLPNRLLVGLGTGAEIGEIKRQAIPRIDLYDRYFNHVTGEPGKVSWVDWTKPAGDYVFQVARAAEAVGAVPMITLYQMATRGDSNLSGLTEPRFMQSYWANVKLLLQKLGTYNKPALINLEPDFWGYSHRLAIDHNPATVVVRVKVNAECADLADHLPGFTECFLRMARRYAPKTKVGLPPSDWGERPTQQVVDYMRAAGAAQADFVVMQTLDGDAGCFEARQAPYCTRPNIQYWDELNQQSPNFREHLGAARLFHEQLGLPLIWWQTPMGVASPKPGGQPGRWRDNRMQYFLTHPQELVAVGAVAVVFSKANPGNTDLTTDGGQFQRLFTRYVQQPAPLTVTAPKSILP